MEQNAILAMLLENLIPMTVTLLGTALLLLLKRRGAKQETRRLVQEAYALLGDCVLYVDQVYVDALKRANGRLTEAQKAEAKALCAERFRALAGDAVRMAVETTYRSCEQWLATMAEAQVRSAHTAPPQLGAAQSDG